MARAYLKEEPNFTPVILEIQTKKEFDFLHGLFNSRKDVRKQDCSNYSERLDHVFFNQLDDIEEKFF